MGYEKKVAGPTGGSATGDFHINKGICAEIAIIQSKKLHSKIAELPYYNRFKYLK